MKPPPDPDQDRKFLESMQLIVTTDWYDGPLSAIWQDPEGHLWIRLLALDDWCDGEHISRRWYRAETNWLMPPEIPLQEIKDILEQGNDEAITRLKARATDALTSRHTGQEDQSGRYYRTDCGTIRGIAAARDIENQHLADHPPAWALHPWQSGVEEG